MVRTITSRRGAARAASLVVLLVLSLALPAGARPGFLTRERPMLELADGAPKHSSIRAIISSGDTLDGFLFEGIPDGIGIVPGDDGTVDVFVAHEQSHVPFLGQADLEDASVSRLTLDTRTGAVLSAEVALPSSAGFIRFCSAFMAGPAEGFEDYTFFLNEESDDDLSVPAGATYGADPAIAPLREAGYAVALDTESGSFAPIPGMGRHNHENTVVVPGGWDETVALSGDDTFAAPASQLYLYSARSPEELVADEGRLFAFRVTATDDGPVDPEDAFNGANDYGDIAVGDDWEGRFTPVPKDVAEGTLPGVTPQKGLEDWSNANNVFQFIRVEDIAYDRNEPNVVYFADTGERRAIPDATTGRLRRGSSSTNGPYPNGRIFRMELDPDDPRRVVSFSILLDADAGGYSNLAVMHQPDNIDTSENSLMVQEDSGQAPSSRIWRYDFATQVWSVVASVKDPAWESSGIVDASDVFGDGAWLVDVQGHGDFVETQQVGATLYKRESGQLLLLRLPGS